MIYNLYDALEYIGQVKEATRSHRAEMKKRSSENGGTPGSDEFLSGFWKNIRLIPSITVTIYFGSDEWDGPLSLFDMMDISKEPLNQSPYASSRHKFPLDGVRKP